MRAPYVSSMSELSPLPLDNLDCTGSDVVYRRAMLLWANSVKPIRLTPCGKANVSFGRQTHADYETIRVRWRD